MTSLPLNHSRGVGGHRPGLHDRPGLTLIELVIAILLLAIMATIAMPKFAATLNAISVKSAAQRMARDIGLVRSWARVTSQTQTVTFSTALNSYTLSGVPNANHSTSPNTVPLSNGTLNATLASLNLGSNQGAPITTLTFNGFGVPVGLPAGGGQIVVSSGTVNHTLTVDSAAGFVTIQ